MELEIVIWELINGLAIGGIFGMISIGLSLTFGALRILNFAHGLFYGLAAYILYALIIDGLNFSISALLAVALITIFGYLYERVFLRRMYGGNIDYTLLATYAITVTGIGIIKLIWGADYKQVNPPISGTVNLQLNISIDIYRILIILVSLIVFILVIIMFRYTNIGKIIVGFVENREELEMLGINPRRPVIIVFMLGTALASLAGVLHAPIYTVYPYMAYDMILIAFAIVVTGGLGSLMGSLVTSYIFGIVYALISIIHTSLSYVSIFLMMALILIIKPEGLFGER